MTAYKQIKTLCINFNEKQIKSAKIIIHLCENNFSYTLLFTCHHIHSVSIQKMGLNRTRIAHQEKKRLANTHLHLLSPTLTLLCIKYIFYSTINISH